MTALAGLLMAVVPARPAAAHGALRRSDPAARARLAVPPAALRLTFSEPADLNGTHIRLLDAAGKPVVLGAAVHATPDSSHIVVVPVTGAMPAGRYTVTWQVTGRDGHPVRGRYWFEVTGGAAGGGAAPAWATAGAAAAGARPDTTPARGAPPENQDTTPAVAGHHHDPATIAGSSPIPPEEQRFGAESGGYAAIRWASYVALLAAIGAAALALLVGGGDDVVGAPMAAALRPRLAALGLAASWGAIALAFVRLMAQSYAVHGSKMMFSPMLVGPMIGASTWGRAWLLQLAAAILGAVGFTLALRAPGRSPGWRLAQAAALVAALGSAMTGHAAAVEGALGGVAIAADAVHLLAAGAWIGGLLAIVMAGLPAARRLPAGTRGQGMARLVARFSPWALAGAATLAVSGVVGAWVHLGAPAALWRTRYGVTLLVKLALVGAVAAAGAFNWRRVAPTLGEDAGVGRLARSAAVELALAALVLAVTAVLVATPPEG